MRTGQSDYKAGVTQVLGLEHSSSMPLGRGNPEPVGYGDCLIRHRAIYERTSSRTRDLDERPSPEPFAQEIFGKR